MTGSVFTGALGFLRGVGNQAAVSVAASAMAAAFLALPAGFSLPFLGAAAEQGDTGRDSTEGWVLPVASDGKIRARHQDAASGDAPLLASDARGLISPAAIVMPMALQWTQPVVEIAALPQVRSTPSSEPRARLVQAQALPPRRPAIERAVAVSDTAPLQIAPRSVQVVATTTVPNEVARRPQRSVLGVTMPAPVSRVGDAVSGAVGLVGAAGTWTLARASDLLPRL